MSEMTANVKKLRALIVKAKDADQAVIDGARSKYAAAVEAAGTKRKDAIAYIVANLTEALATGVVHTNDGEAYVQAFASGRRADISVKLPEGVSANGQEGLPFNPDGDGETEDSVAAALGVATQAWHQRTLDTLDVNEGDTIVIDTTQFSYYL